MIEKNYKTIKIRLDNEIYRKLRDISKVVGLNEHQIIVTLLFNYIIHTYTQIFDKTKINNHGVDIRKEEGKEETKV